MSDNERAARDFLMQRTKCSVWFLLLLLVALNCPAQDHFLAIRVSVTDGDGAVIPGARVVAVNREDHLTLKATTNLAGECTFPHPALGNYFLTVKKRGFFAETAKAEVAMDSGVVHVEIRMRCRKCRQPDVGRER